ncbi:MAG: hemerythrin family protein [Candidatus Zambryskibacteria bacterium]|nr:hemerythrin family protein [Candidatus Zambryskibacteria bacterium]
MEYRWIEKYSVGIKEIDKQHQHYFEIVNKIIKMTGQSSISAEEITLKIKELNDYAIYHFTTEEKLFKEYDYNEAIEHNAQHRIYEDKMDEFINQISQENADNKKVATKIASFAGSWLLNHIMNMDQKYSGFMRKHGVK